MKSESEIKSKIEAAKPTETVFWRAVRPVVDAKIEADRSCAIFCPHNAIEFSEQDKKIKIDYNLCDGCLICLRECHSGAIKESRDQ